MKITTYHQSNPEIEIVEINGELTGRGSVKLGEFLCTSLDEGRCYKIIDLSHMKKADGLGLSVLEYFINRGMRIRLFNPVLEFQSLLKISGKEGVIKTYKCKKSKEAVLLFEKELQVEQGLVNDNVNGRRHTRLNTSFQTEFRYSTVNNDEFTYKAVIENLSEGGISTGQITASNSKTGERLNQLQMVGKDFCCITFSLNGDSRIIETNGECVWENRKYERQYAGIRFKDMNQSHREMIRDYVHKQEYN
jgi:hypothetical protein